MWNWKLELHLAGYTLLAQLTGSSYWYAKAKGLSKLKTHIYLERAKMTKSLWLSIMRKGNWTCKFCSVSTYGEMEVDHVVPVSKLGRTVEANLQVLCRRCNKRKGNRLM